MENAVVLIEVTEAGIVMLSIKVPEIMLAGTFVSEAGSLSDLSSTQSLNAPVPIEFTESDKEISLSEEH